MGFLKSTQPRRGCAAFGPGAIPRRALPKPPAPWRRPLTALVVAGSIGTIGLAATPAAAAESGHRDAATDSARHTRAARSTAASDSSAQQNSASATSSSKSRYTSRAQQTERPKRAANTDRDCDEQHSVARRAVAETSGQDSTSTKKSQSSTGKKYRSSYKKAGYNNKKQSTSKSSNYSGKSSKSSSGKYYNGSTTSGKKSSSGSSSSSGNYSYTNKAASSGSSSTPATDAAASSGSTTVVDGAAAPLAKGTYKLSAGFGATGSWSRYHTGQDFSASSGTPVYAATSGTVVSGNVGSWAGNYVAIRAADGSSTLYAHLSSTDVKVGQQVTAGQKIGNGGTTGRSFGAHLHFEYYPSGVTPGDVYSASNPMSYLRSIGVSM